MSPPRTVLPRLLLAGSLALAAAWSSQAWAQAAPLGEDEVSLRTGGMVRGTVTTIETGVRVVIVEASTGQTRVIPWAEVGDVERGKYRAPPTGAPGSTGSAASTREPGGVRGRVTIHIDSPRPVNLVEQNSYRLVKVGDTLYYHLRDVERCASPCDATIDGRQGQVFAVSGDGVPESETFELTGRSGDTTITVDPGSSLVTGMGRVLLVPGVGSAVLGAVLLGISSSDEAPEDFAPMGGILIGAGVALALGGIALLVAGDTDVSLSSAQAPSATSRSASPPSPWPRLTGASPTGASPTCASPTCAGPARRPWHGGL